MSEFDFVQTYAATPAPSDPGVKPGESDPTIPGTGWLYTLAAILQKLLPGQGKVPQYPAGDHRNDMAITPFTPKFDVPSSGQIVNNLTDGFTAGANILGKSFTDGLTVLEHSAEVGGVFLLLALLFVGSLFIFLTSKSQ